MIPFQTVFVMYPGRVTSTPLRRWNSNSIRQSCAISGSRLD